MGVGDMVVVVGKSTDGKNHQTGGALGRGTKAQSRSLRSRVLPKISPGVGKKKRNDGKASVVNNGNLGGIRLACNRRKTGANQKKKGLFRPLGNSRMSGERTGGGGGGGGGVRG